MGRPRACPAPAVSAAIKAGTDAISLAWTRSPPSASYAVERSTDGSPFAPQRVDIPVNSARAAAPIAGADLGHTLSCRVAETLAGATVRPGAATVVLPPALEAPRGLAAAPSAPGASIVLEWRDSPIASGYHVEMAVPGGDFGWIATVGQGPHAVGAVAAATAHEFRAVAHVGGRDASAVGRG